MMTENLTALMRYRMDQAEDATEHNRECASESTSSFSGSHSKLRRW